MISQMDGIVDFEQGIRSNIRCPHFCEDCFRSKYNVIVYEELNRITAFQN